MSNSVILGPRLKTVAGFVPEGAMLGDIGTDHAYLPIALYESRRISKAIAVDVHVGPYQSAVNAVKGRDLEEFIDVRFGDGLMPLKAGEVNTLTLAGMGGKTMLEILSARPDVLEAVDNLILQPQGAEGAVRLTLLEAGWRLKAELLVKEDERIYVVIAFSRGQGSDANQLADYVKLWSKRLRPIQQKFGIQEHEFQELVHRLLWLFGPLVLEVHTDLLRDYLNDHSGMLLRRLEQMKNSQSIEVLTKIREVCNELTLVEGLWTWQ